MKFKKYLSIYSDLPVGAKASIWFLMGNILQKGMSTLTTPIFTRLMTSSEYGEYSVYTSWLSCLTVIVTLSLSSETILLGIVKHEDDVEKYVSSMQGLVTCLVTIGVIIYLPLHNYWESLFHLPTRRVMAIFLSMWLATIYGYWNQRQRVNNAYKNMLVIIIASAILHPCLGILAIKLLPINTVDARIIANLFLEAVLFGSLSIGQWTRKKAFYNHLYWNEALGQTIPLLPHYLSENILSVSDRVIIERLVGTSAAGIYSLSYSISMLMTILSSAIVSTLQPFLFRSLEHEDFSKTKQTCKIALLLVAGANFMLVAVAPEIIKIFAPIEYTEAMYLIAPLATSSALLFVYSVFSSIEFYYGKNQYMTLFSVLTALLNIGLNFIMIPIYGYVAAGYTTLISYLAYAGMHAFASKKILEGKGISVSHVFDIKSMVYIVLFLLICNIGIKELYPCFALRYITIAIVALCGIIYLKKDKETIKQVLHKKI